MHSTVQRDDVLEAWAFSASSRKTGAHRHCGEQVVCDTLTPEGLDAKCEQGEKMSVQLQTTKRPNAAANPSFSRLAVRTRSNPAKRKDGTYHTRGSLPTTPQTAKPGEASLRPTRPSPIL